jgi:hypothetical protein
MLWVARLGLVAWAICLVWWGGALASGAAAPLGLSTLADGRALVDWLRPLAARAALEMARFVPLGILAALSLPRRDHPAQRLVGVWVPSLVLSGLLAAGIRILEAGRPWRAPFPEALLGAAAGCLAGVWIGVTLTKGLRSFLLLPLKLALVAGLVLAAGVALLREVIQPDPLGFEPARVTSEEKRRLYRAFKGKSPMQLTAGQSRELKLSGHDLDVLLAWGLSLRPGLKARVALEGPMAHLEASAGSPRLGFLNVVGSFEPAVADGEANLWVDRLRIGALALPAWLARPLAGVVLRRLQSDPRLSRMLHSIQRLRVEGETLVLAYGPGQLPPGLVSDLFHGEGAGGADHVGVRAQLARLAERAARTSPGSSDDRHAAAVEAAFAHARERSRAGTAAGENRSAILALGLTLGSRRLASLVGGIPPAELSASWSGWRGSSLQGRKDWVRHFWVSALLTVLSLSEASDAAGLLKEELDADGGSGFSFADLLADRSGTVFAEHATRDEGSARALQERLAAGFDAYDVFPPAGDLPEGLSEVELRTRYGGVGGERYQDLMAEIDSRIAALPAYRD